MASNASRLTLGRYLPSPLFPRQSVYRRGLRLYALVLFQARRRGRDLRGLLSPNIILTPTYGTSQTTVSVRHAAVCPPRISSLRRLGTRQGRPVVGVLTFMVLLSGEVVSMFFSQGPHSYVSCPLVCSRVASAGARLQFRTYRGISLAACIKFHMIHR
ncbi:uncharacterized protein B0T15DRAFT_182910 [Chaetomium strumarium]|uniref:Uncharacterized protein n=1 Tax=Chaetomium strumarium TaxID=1170767 RepID=A0AAJ0GWW6_9PEZI|nr:hypothetical protein B0T15DRAFT_182910 [Chaetomium strumarium]